MSSLTPHDDNASLIAFYGDPRKPGWEAENLVHVVVPWRMFYGRTTVSTITFHKKAAPALRAVFSALVRAPGITALEAGPMGRYSGSYNQRFVRGSEAKLSVHNFAAAADFDAANELMNTHHVSHMPQYAIDAFKANGFWWGGDFHSRQDPMHFQFAHE